MSPEQSHTDRSNGGESGSPRPRRESRRAQNASSAALSCGSHRETGSRVGVVRLMEPPSARPARARPGPGLRAAGTRRAQGRAQADRQPMAGGGEGLAVRCRDDGAWDTPQSRRAPPRMRRGNLRSGCRTDRQRGSCGPASGRGLVRTPTDRTQTTTDHRQNDFNRPATGDGELSLKEHREALRAKSQGTTTPPEHHHGLPARGYTRCGGPGP